MKMGDDSEWLVLNGRGVLKWSRLLNRNVLFNRNEKIALEKDKQEDFPTGQHTGLNVKSEGFILSNINISK